jgi:hypothetical protein
MRPLQHGLRRGACHSHADVRPAHTSVPCISVSRLLETKRLNYQPEIVTFSAPHQRVSCLNPRLG